jgi:uncharacterized protein (TIGR02118 family)
MPWLAAIWAPDEAAIAALGAVDVRRALADQGRYAGSATFDVLVHGDDDPPGGLAAAGSRVWAAEVDTERPRVGPEECSVTMVALLRRAPRLTAAEFAEHWRRRHTPLALRHHEGLSDYAQHVVVRELVPMESAQADQIDGVAELGFVTRADFETRFYDSDAGRKAIGEDVRRFMAGPGPDTTLLGPASAR